VTVAGRHHVLLIGIDAYDGGGMLTGCVNDIDAIQRLLIDRVGVRPEQITRLAAPRTGAVHETDVPEVLPTLERLRGELARLGSDAVSPDDRVFIYYSGHGTQCVLVDANGQRFSREALLPKDKVRGVERRFLFDWELNALIAKIAERTAAVTVVLDCCSSGGATREGLDEENTQDRFWMTPDEYPLRPEETGPGDVVRSVSGAAGRVPRCQVVAACRDDERARESLGTGDRAHGELTRALVRQLAALEPEEFAEVRWGRIWRAVEAEVRQANPRQSPWLSGSFGRRLFGFGPDQEGDSGFAVTAVGGQYRLDVGTLAGVTEEAEIAVYGATPLAFPPLGSGDDLAARKGLLRVSRADRSTCEAVAVTPFALPEGARGRLCKAGRAARLRVAVVPPSDALAAELAASSLVERVSEDAELTLVQRSDGAWALSDDVHGSGEVAGEPVLALIPPDRLAVARPVVDHYHAYLTPLRMARACRDLPSLLRLWLLDCTGRTITAAEAQAPDLPQVKAGLRAPYEISVGDWICFVVENGADDALSVILIDCASSGRVLILGEKRIPRRSRHVFWYADVLGSPFEASLPDECSVGVDRIVAIATTRPDVSLGYLERRTSFAELIAPSRGPGLFKDLGEADVGAPAERWTAALTALRITRRPATDPSGRAS
jgi:hypothetical protein